MTLLLVFVIALFVTALFGEVSILGVLLAMLAIAGGVVVIETAAK